MHKKFILFIFTFFIVKILSANNYMMNCFSPDYKNGAFYKYVKKDKKLLSRPVKQKWTNFCGKSADNIKSECSFEGLKVKKLFVQEDSEKVLKISYVVNFADYSFVEIKSNNYLDNPKIQFNYLENDEDLQQMRDSVKIANKIFMQNSMKMYLGEQLRPGYNTAEKELDNIIRETADTAYHPSCTNKMGVDSMSVVDQETKVYGVDNLRVIDSSIMPDILSGNLNAGTIMIAEKAADMILGKEEKPIDAEYYKKN